MFVINPDPYSIPIYRIGTFVTESIVRNNGIASAFTQKAVEYFNNRFGEENWVLTKNGREAIDLAMSAVVRSNQMLTTILTPSNNFYISGCVTSVISKHTLWNREKSTKTAIYLVNHEFGYLYPDMSALVNEGKTIIEDCCTTFFSQDENNKIGQYGDFSVYSFPKFFSIQIGGLLVGKGIALKNALINKIELSQEEKEYILKVVGFELGDNEQILNKRKIIFDYAVNRFKNLGFTLRFDIKTKVIPSVLLLNNNGVIHNLHVHKEYLNNHGIQNSIFYGEDAFFIPNHSMLSKIDIDYFEFVIKTYIEKQ